MFGVAFSNLLQDVLFHIDEYMRLLYTGNFFQLLNPFGLLASIVSLTMLVTQGATYPTGEIYLRLRMAAHIATLMMELCFLLADICLMKGIDGYVVTSALDTMAESNPLRKAVAHQADAWLINFNTYPLLWALPVLGIIVLQLFTVLFLRLEKGALAFINSSLTITCVILTTGVTMFLFVMPSSTVPSISLTMWDATSSLFMLKVMTIVALIILPIVLAYTSWSYYKMFGRPDKNHIENHKHSLY